MPANMKNAGLLLSLIATVLAVLVIEATCAHALVVDKDEMLPKDVTDSTTDWLEQEAIYRLLKALHTQKDYPSFAPLGPTDDSRTNQDSMKRSSPRSIDHMEDKIRYLSWCRKMGIARCYV